MQMQIPFLSTRRVTLGIENKYMKKLYVCNNKAIFQTVRFIFHRNGYQI